MGPFLVKSRFARIMSPQNGFLFVLFQLPQRFAQKFVITSTDVLHMAGYVGTLLPPCPIHRKAKESYIPPKRTAQGTHLWASL